MKRSKKVRLLLLGGASTALLAGCDQKPAISTDNFYTNNFYIPGAGYYHAPFRAWYPLPYNHLNTMNGLYFYGGQWANAPYESITNISSPTPQAVELAQSERTDIARGGFGGTGGHWFGGGWSFGGDGYHGFHA